MGLQNDAFCYASGGKFLGPPDFQEKNPSTPPKLQGKKSKDPLPL